MSMATFFWWLLHDELISLLGMFCFGFEIVGMSDIMVQGINGSLR